MVGTPIHGFEPLTKYAYIYKIYTYLCTDKKINLTRYENDNRQSSG